MDPSGVGGKYKVFLGDVGGVKSRGMTQAEKGHAGNTGSRSLCWRKHGSRTVWCPKSELEVPLHPGVAKGHLMV